MTTNASAKPAQAAQTSNSESIFPLIVIPATMVVAVLFYLFFLGNGANFKGGDSANEPLNVWGIIFKGGFIVPMLITLLLLVIIFSIERFLTISRAQGAGKPDAFLRSIKKSLDTNDVNSAIALCDKQKGSLANVVRQGLGKYREMQNETKLEKDQKMVAIQKEIEEATTLELPMLEKNLIILATIISIATLFGLIGTVLGMIRSFAAMSEAGAPNQAELATGISEALINTALGISTSAIAIIAYNYFTSSIDQLTYRIDEAGYSLQQTFAAQNH